MDVTRGYPYFIQEWGKHTWNTANASPIAEADVETASASATMALDRNFFRVRFDRLTPREQDYLRAMAELGAGPHRSGVIAEELGASVESVGPLRNGLIRKGMIWSPAHGDTAFTVPMFDEFHAPCDSRVATVGNVEGAQKEVTDAHCISSSRGPDSTWRAWQTRPAFHGNPSTSFCEDDARSVPKWLVASRVCSPTPRSSG